MKYLTYYNGMFRWTGGYATKDTAKLAGMYWNQNERQWQTSSVEVAMRLKQYFDPAAEEEVERRRRVKEQELAASMATDSDIQIPVPDGLEYLNYQKAGVNYAHRRDGTLIADEMGLGKTIQAIGLMNLMGREATHILVICPATLKINWQRELDKWLVRPLSIGIADTKKGWPDTDVVIVNYDILPKFSRQTRSRVWDVVVVDEAHYAKNSKAKRTIEIVGEKEWDSYNKQWVIKYPPIQARKRLLLTGTPIYNKPQDLWTLVDYCLLTTPFAQRFQYFRGRKTFLERYVGYHHGRYGWEFGEPRHLDELQENLRLSIMIRRLKSQVLNELPPKIRQVIEVDSSGYSAVIKAEYEHARKKQDSLLAAQVELELAKASGDDDAYHAAVRNLKDACKVSFSELAKIRHDVGLATAKAGVGVIKDAVESTKKLVVFAHHRDVIEYLESELTSEDVRVVKVVGGMSSEEKQRAVDAFQNDPEVKVFIGSLTAAGTGITLTASSQVILVELDWVPANIEQAEDRCHRIGQTEPVLVQHLVLEGSLTARIAKAIVEKQTTNKKALDNAGKGTEDRPEFLDEPVVPATVMPTEDAPSSASVVLTPRQQIEAEATTLSENQRAAIYSMVSALASVCDNARNADSAGFNKLDAMIGHRLANTPYDKFSMRMAALAKMFLRKYRKQLVEMVGPEAYETVYGQGSAQGPTVRKRNPAGREETSAADELDLMERMRGL